MSKAAISKAEKIRVALQLLSPDEDLSAPELEEVTGIKNVAVNLGAMVQSGEVKTSGERGSYRYKLNPSYKPKRKAGIDRTLPVKRKGKKKTGKVKPRAAAKKKRTGLIVMKPEMQYQDRPTAVARWALASDGAFVLLGTPTEIPRTAARALIEFVRALDQGRA